MLDLGMTPGMLDVGRPGGDPNRKERHQGRYQVETRVQRTGEESEAAGDQAGRHLEHDQAQRGNDGGQSRFLLRVHELRLVPRVGSSARINQAAVADRPAPGAESRPSSRATRYAVSYTHLTLPTILR